MMMTALKAERLGLALISQAKRHSKMQEMHDGILNKIPTYKYIIPPSDWSHHLASVKHQQVHGEHHTAL